MFSDKQYFLNAANEYEAQYYTDAQEAAMEARADDLKDNLTNDDWEEILDWAELKSDEAIEDLVIEGKFDIVDPIFEAAINDYCEFMAREHF